MRSAITDRRIRVAVVGCGRIAASHFKAIEAHHDDLELVAVCDTDAATLHRAAESQHTAGYASLPELLRSARADLLALCTPSGLHPRRRSSRRAPGRHVMTEKPMATRWQDGQRMVRECDAAGVQLFVVKQNRRNPTLQLLKRAIEKQRFGRIYMVTINVFWSRPQSYYDSAKWRGTWEFDGGAFMNQASHYVDLIDWLIGPVESVQAYTATLAAQHPGRGHRRPSAVRWRSGALGSINVTMLTYRKQPRGLDHDHRREGTVRVGGVAVNEIQHWEFAEPRSGRRSGRERQLPDDLGLRLRPSAATTTTSSGCMRGEAEPETDGREGLRSLELLIAIYLSARDGRRVALPLEY